MKIKTLENQLKNHLENQLKNQLENQLENQLVLGSNLQHYSFQKMLII